MRIDVHIHAEGSDGRLDAIHQQLLTVLAMLQAGKIREEKMDADIQAVIDQATANENAEQAADAALVSLFGQLQAAIAASASLSPADRATLQAKVTEMKASADAVAAAIVANTPAATPAP